MNVFVPPARLTKLRHALCLGTAIAALAIGALPRTADAAACTLGIACTVDASSSTMTLDPGNTIYSFTVNNPANTWTVTNLPAPLAAEVGSSSANVTANGLNPVTGLVSGAGGTSVQLSVGGLTANYGALAGIASGGGSFFPIGTTGAVLSGLTGQLAMGMWSPSGIGTQSVTVKANTDPTLLAGVNVFAKEHALNADTQGSGPGKIATGVTLAAGNTYYIHPTNPTQTWAIGNDAGRTATANGVDPNTVIWNGQYDGQGQPVFGPELLCTSPFWDGCKPRSSNTFGDGGLGQFIPGFGVANGYRFGELVALVNGKYYGVGNGLKLTGVNGDLYLLVWDDESVDNFGFINVAVNLVVPEPASMLLLGTALLGFGLARRRRQVG